MTLSPVTLLLLTSLAVPISAQSGNHYLTSSAAQSQVDDGSVLIQQARAQMEAGDFATAEQILNRVLTSSPNSPAANNTLGQLLLTQHRYPEAMDRFETVLDLNLRDTQARAGELQAATQLALDTRKAGNLQAAFLCLEHAREHLPDDPTLLLDLGIQGEQVHQLPVAQDALEAALHLRPADPQTLYALSRVELDREHFADSERHLRTYLAAKPDDPTAHFGLGHLLAMQQHTPEARAEFERSLQLQPLQTESWYQLGQIALDAGNAGEARPLFVKALARDPHHGGALTGLGILDYREKNYSLARAELAKAVESSPEYQPAHYYLGLTLAHLGLKADSDRELKIATDLAHSQGPHTSSTAVQRSPTQVPQ